MANIADPVSLQEASNYSQEDLARTYIHTCIHTHIRACIHGAIYCHTHAHFAHILLFLSAFTCEYVTSFIFKFNLI